MDNAAGEVAFRSGVKRFLGPSAVGALRGLREVGMWIARDYAAPAPPPVKRVVIRRNAISGGTFVETGTYLGDTAAYARTFSSAVVTLEPDPSLYEAAAKRFAGDARVKVLNATSEVAFPSLMTQLEGNVTFWLDGHYSGGVTFKGAHDTPIVIELKCIGAHIERFTSLSILVDDIRSFGADDGYPPLSRLVHWADEQNLVWHIEHDIMVMRKAGRP